MQQKSRVDWESNIGTIKEIYSGQFQIILDFATTAFLPHLIRDDHRYIWISQHRTGDYFSWNSYSLPLFDADENYKIVARQLNFDFILPTEEFKPLLTKIQRGITLTQVNIQPQHYLDNRLQGRTRYDLLKKECDYLFEVMIPSANDYGTLISPNRAYLEELLSNENINWNNLP